MNTIILAAIVIVEPITILAYACASGFNEKIIIISLNIDEVYSMVC
jgi:hypothetical protein